MRRFNVTLISCPLLILCLCYLGCATIVSKSQYPVMITSNPSDVEFTVSDVSGRTVVTGRTPTTVTLKAGAGFFKGQHYTVIFEKDGFARSTAPVRRGVDGWYIGGNILVGGVIGWLIVDPMTGAMWTLSDVHANLAPSPTSLKGEDAPHSKKHKAEDFSFRLISLDELSTELHPHLVRINESDTR